MNRRRAGARTAPEHPDPRLRGALYAVPYAEVWSAAVTVARTSERWTVTSTDSRAGQIVAEATTPLWNLVDDVVINLSLDDLGFTRVDLSSHSRRGRYDFGVNRRRIGRFLRRLERAVDRS